MKEVLTTALIDETASYKELHKAVKSELARGDLKIVILDDDPTGTQTMYDVPVLTTFERHLVERELVNTQVLFLLTNSRSLAPSKAERLAFSIGQILKRISEKHGLNLILVSRSDSTLRGHYPLEVNALSEGYYGHLVDHILAPAFFEGGRYTYEDIHYAKENDTFVPVADTPFAQDGSFSFSSSDLQEYIIEKHGKQRIEDDCIVSIPLNEVRRKKANLPLAKGHCGQNFYVVNALNYADLYTIALSCLRSEKDLIYRTAASFINALSATKPKGLIDNDKLRHETNDGGLTVIGSYVPKTNRQFNQIQEHCQVKMRQLEVKKIIDGSMDEQMIQELASEINEGLTNGEDQVLYTSRTLMQRGSKEANLKIINQVSHTLREVIKKIQNKPKYLIAKGGITSSDLATYSLSVKKAEVLGQALPGVPVWKLGEESKFPGLPYIIFPGNVGDDSALSQLINRLA